LQIVPFWDFAGKLCYMWSNSFRTFSQAVWEILQQGYPAPSSPYPRIPLAEPIVDLKAHIQLSACAPEDVIFTSNEDVLVIITTADGLSKSHRLASQNESLPSNDRLKYQLDQIICLHYIPSIWCRTATTGFITSALLGRGYLSLLFPSSVTDNAETSLDDLCLFNLLLTSLEKSIFEVENGFNKAKVQNDERYWTELSAALAILSFGLLHAQEGLNNHTIMPSCVSGSLSEGLRSTQLTHGRVVNT
jgi:hypothetical protein